MAVLVSQLDTSSEAYASNRAHQLDIIAALDEQLRLAVAGGGHRQVQRHRERGSSRSVSDWPSWSTPIHRSWSFQPWRPGAPTSPSELRC